ncbi:MAG: DsrE family protein [Promethearchaeota archaeon]
MTAQKFLFLMTESPYFSPLLPSNLDIIEKILELKTEVENVVLFFYMDGIHQLNSEQLTQNFQNIGKRYSKLHEEHPTLQFYACSRCTAARGYLDLQKSDIENNLFISKKLLPFVEIVSIRKLGEHLKDGYRIIQN